MAIAKDTRKEKQKLSDPDYEMDGFVELHEGF